MLENPGMGRFGLKHRRLSQFLSVLLNTAEDTLVSDRTLPFPNHNPVGVGVYNIKKKLDHSPYRRFWWGMCMTYWS
jgi:hypothetical protein